MVFRLGTGSVFATFKSSSPLLSLLSALAYCKCSARFSGSHNIQLEMQQRKTMFDNRTGVHEL